jgi:hypothetical protein
MTPSSTDRSVILFKVAPTERDAKIYGNDGMREQEAK